MIGSLHLLQMKLKECCTLFVDGDWIESKDQSPEGIRLVQTGNIGNGRYLEKESRAKYISEETFETVNDVMDQPVMAPAGQIALELPESASAQTALGAEENRLYFCDGYTVTVQTMERGDLKRTAKSLCGFDTAELKIVETSDGDIKRWDWVWTAAGEGGDAIGRAAVIDDGKYHYCVTVMADAQKAGEMEDQWAKLFRSFRID